MMVNELKEKTNSKDIRIMMLKAFISPSLRLATRTMRLRLMVHYQFSLIFDTLKPFII